MQKSRVSADSQNRRLRRSLKRTSGPSEARVWLQRYGCRTGTERYSGKNLECRIELRPKCSLMRTEKCYCPHKTDSKNLPAIRFQHGIDQTEFQCFFCIHIMIALCGCHDFPCCPARIFSQNPIQPLPAFQDMIRHDPNI